MTLKKTAGKIHLWLGLSTGLVVIIVAVTGAIYCFAPELQNLQSYRTVDIQDKSFLPPSQILHIAQETLPGKNIQRVYYGARNKSIMVLFSKNDVYNYSAFINPYTGKLIRLRNNDGDFLTVVLQIHRTLKIPFGHDIIRWSTVIFIFMIITGLVLWWPKKRRKAGKAFTIMWRASHKRMNYDLHKVLGFYVSWIAIFMALTGLMFAFESFSGFTYKLTGVQNSIIINKPPVSDTSMKTKEGIAPIDRVWSVVGAELYKKYATVMLVLPAAKDGAYLVRANPEKTTLYKSDFRYFDQYSGQEFPGAYVWGRYKDAHTAADNIRRMNYDLHTGAIFGLPGRLLLFFAAIVVASLPVTGFYFWWGRKKKRKPARIKN